MSIDTLVSIIGTVIIVVTAGIAIWQLREAARARSLDGFLALAENLKEDAEAREFIYDKLASLRRSTAEEKRKLLSDPKLRGEIKKVCVSFEVDKTL